MDVEEKLKLALRLPTEEVVTIEELRDLFERVSEPRFYNGFEPSGLAHLGTGVISVLKANDLIEAGARVIFLLADLHARINRKLGGNLEHIRKAARYFIHVRKSLGIKERAEFVLASEIYNEEYREEVLKTSMQASLRRFRRALTIAGRQESDELPLGMYIYIAMQVTDIHRLDLHGVEMGMDQRKATMLAREIAEKLNRRKPVAIHHHLLMSLQGPQRMDAKMSKSKPETAIFVHDSPEEIRKKIRKAYCPAKDPNNPIMDILRHIILREPRHFVIERPERYGGSVEVWSYEELEKLYVEGKIHPLDLKKAVAEELIKLLEPSRRYFEENREARELLEFMKRLTITRRFLICTSRSLGLRFIIYPLQARTSIIRDR